DDLFKIDGFVEENIRAPNTLVKICPAVFRGGRRVPGAPIGLVYGRTGVRVICFITGGGQHRVVYTVTPKAVEEARVDAIARLAHPVVVDEHFILVVAGFDLPIEEFLTASRRQQKEY